MERCVCRTMIIKLLNKSLDEHFAHVYANSQGEIYALYGDGSRYYLPKVSESANERIKVVVPPKEQDLLPILVDAASLIAYSAQGVVYDGGKPLAMITNGNVYDLSPDNLTIPRGHYGTFSPK